MASNTVWWKDGDSEHVVPNKPKTNALELCRYCGAALGIHGKVGKVLVHPGDTIVTKDGGDIDVVRPDPFAGVQ